MVGPQKILSGKRFGQLIVGDEFIKVKSQYSWKCVCDCGGVRWAKAAHLTSGMSRRCKSCHDKSRADRIVHGFCRKRSENREYHAWRNALNRCTNPKNKKYPDYGGRGIRMCPEWVESAQTFLSDMGPCPDGLSLDRIDNTKGYEPSNCRWASYSQQNRNHRRNRIMPNGMCVTDFCISFGLDRTHFNNILCRRNDLVEAVLMSRPAKSTRTHFMARYFAPTVSPDLDINLQTPCSAA